MLFCIALIVLPVGKVRIGGPDAQPMYSYASWVSMLFAAGMGVGLLACFQGGEHATDRPLFPEAPGGSE